MAHINLDTEQTMETDVKNKLQQVVWCCGDLRTGAISIGVTCIVSSILLSLYFIESELQDRFSMNIIVVCLLTLFLIVSDVGLVYGATKHYKWLTMPWMGLHLALVIFLVFYMAINYQSMDGTSGAAPIKSVIIASILTLMYFYAVVVLYYRELKEKEEQEKINNKDNLAKVLKHNETDVKHEQQCLINLEELNNATNTTTNADQVAVTIDNPDETRLSSNNPFRADDTFTQLANRTQPEKTGDKKLLVIPPNNHYNISTLDDSGEFAVPTSATSTDVNKSFKFPLPGEISDMVNRLGNQSLPTPVEVISIKDKETLESQNEGINSNLNISGDHSRNPFLNDESLTETKDEECLLKLSKVKNNENTNSVGNIVGINEENSDAGHPLLPAKSEPQMLLKLNTKHSVGRKKSDNVVNMDLVDSSFTPYKKKSVSNGHILHENGDIPEEDLPKMKIFLPKQNDDSSDDGDSSLSSDNEDISTTNV